MRTSTDCISRADECRRLAKLAAQPGDWQHFLEMATTWDMLAKQRKADEQVADEQLADEQLADEQVADEQLADERAADVQAAYEQLAVILALADDIANGRAPLRPF
jgi:hypothetical protein